MPRTIHQNWQNDTIVDEDNDDGHNVHVAVDDDGDNDNGD